MKIRLLALSAVPLACLCPVGCGAGSGGVDAIATEGADGVSAADAASTKGPKAVPPFRRDKRTRSEAAGPLPPPKP